MELVAIKVRIGLDHKGHHKYPAFNALPSGVREGLDWSRFIDKYGGWLYDRKAGHRDADTESPAGYWFGIIVVPELFAAESADLWPDEITVLSQSEASQWYEARVSHDQPDIVDDVETLQAIAAKVQIGLPLSDDDQRALDPDDERRGRRRNTEKRFSDMIQKRGTAISEAAVNRVKQKHQEAMRRRDRG